MALDSDAIDVGSCYGYQLIDRGQNCSLLPCVDAGKRSTGANWPRNVSDMSLFTFVSCSFTTGSLQRFHRVMNSVHVFSLNHRK